MADAIYVLPCNHDSVTAPQNIDCMTCKRFLNDANFRRLVIKSQENKNGHVPCRYISDSPIDRLDCDCQSKWHYECDVYGTCCRNDPQNKDGIQSCSQCPQYRSPQSDEPDATYIRLILKNPNAPGDATAMTAAVQSLHLSHPGRYITDVETHANDAYKYNPFVRKISGIARDNTPVVEVKYDMINSSNQLPIHFIEAYCIGLSTALGVRVPLKTNTPVIYLSDEEKSWIPQVSEMLGIKEKVPYVVVNAGHKRDFTAKFWGHSNYQKLIDILSKDVLLVQVGEASSNHSHYEYKRVMRAVGLTNQRQLIRMVYHAKAAVGPSTFIQHISAGVKTPYVLLLGGREPVIWQHYPKQVTLSTIGTLPCCSDSACWRSRVTKLNDGQDSDDSLCTMPVIVGDNEILPRCMVDIDPEHVASIIKKMISL